MIGERIKHARDASLMTQMDLVEATGLSQPTISDIESGRIRPSDGTVAAIAGATGYPEQFFLQGPLPDLPEGHYRKFQKTPSKVIRQMRAQVRQLLEVVQRAEATNLRLPHVSIVPVRQTPTLDDIEQLAVDVRALLGLGEASPIPNLMRAVERAGVVVVRLAAELDGHDGFSAWPDSSLDGRPLIAMSAGHPGDRDRFTVGHELGHLLLHTGRQNTEPKQAEAEANAFAGALLLPRDVARAALHRPVTLSVLKSVKATYGISMAMAAYRAKDMALIDGEHYLSLMKQLSARGWRREEPVTVTQEQPLLMPKILDALMGSGTVVERANRIALPVFAVNGIMGSKTGDGTATPPWQT